VDNFPDMQKILERLDELAGIETKNNFAEWLERIAFTFLILTVLSAPHSIAATQIAWLSGMLFWTIRLFIKPRPKLVGTPLDFALWIFFGWSIITAIFSYAPDISVGKLRNVALFLIFYFVVNNVRNVRAVKFLAAALIFSCMANVLWLPIERAYGRGVQISGIRADSLFAKAIEFDHNIYLSAKGRDPRLFDNSRPDEGKPLPILEGDTITRANVLNVRTPDELVAEIEKNDVTYLENFHNPLYLSVKVRRGDLLDGANSLERLGITSWKHNRNWRYAGFYGQVITYAEALQMIMSLALGLFIAGVGRKSDAETQRRGDAVKKPDQLSVKEKFARPFFKSPRLRVSASLFLLFCLAGMGFALFMTFTRAAQIALIISVFTIVLANGSRKMLAALAIMILPVALIGYFFMQQNRTINVDGKKDPSVSYRQTVYREAFDLWTSSPRNLFLGVGMDSARRFKEEWHLFDNGRLEASHFHSTPLQLLVERGLPALLLWLLILGIYATTLWREIQNSRFKIKDSEFDSSNPKSKIQNPKSSDWQTLGILLGCFGGLAGFFVSSLVNYSLGDSEVAMVFYLLMGLSVSLIIQNSKLDSTT
jgi:O-antigen ligase